ncbi:unnamed protein product [Bathycoccus prasinos]
MTTGKELVFIFLWTLTRCVAIQLNLWDQSSENWKDFDCASQRGTCLAVEVNSGNYRVMSAYIGKGTRLTIHTNSIEHRSESNITKVNIGITLTVDECIQKVNEAALKFSTSDFLNILRTMINFSPLQNYEQACPTKWLATSGGWCQPPEEYKLFPHWKHFLQNLSESEQYKSEEGLISWQKSMRGGLLHVSLANFDCPQWSRFFFAVRNLNKFTETINLFVEGKVSEAVESNGSRSVDIIARCN